jgi:hypothetical protein
MTRQPVTWTNQQSKSETPLVSGILQRAAVRSVPENEVRSTEEVEPRNFRESRFHHDFSQVPIHRGGLPIIQAKLKIGAVGDKYEQEADRVAKDVVQRINSPTPHIGGEQAVKRQEMQDKDEVMRKPEAEALQREEMPEEEDDDNELRMKPMVQRLSAEDGMATPPDLEASIQRARGSGQPLAESIREPMEQAFGADFTGVRVHTDAQSDQLNQFIQAKAFTTGQDIFFRQGAYEPSSRGGQELMAHELTHVVQQDGGRLTCAKAQAKLAEQSSPIPSISDHFERLQRWPDEDLKQGNIAPGRINADIANAQTMVINHAREIAQKYDSNAFSNLAQLANMNVTKTATFDHVKSWWKDWLMERPNDWGPHNVEWQYQQQSGQQTKKTDTRRDWHLTMDIDDPPPESQAPHVGYEMWATVPLGSNKTKLDKKSIDGIGHVWLDAVWTGR